MYRVDKHMWWTGDRSRLVDDGDPEAAFLAYTAGMEIPDQEARRVGLTRLGSKSRAKTADKAMPRPADKGGLTISRLTDEKEMSS